MTQKLRTWSTRPATDEDLPAIIQLFHDVFGYARPAATHVWRFRSGPAGPGVITVAVEGQRIVGQYALQPTPLLVGGECVSGAQSLDTMTHPDFRGQGMFVALARACMDDAAHRGIEALYGFPNASSFPGFVRRLGWIHCGDASRWVRPIGSDDAASGIRSLLRPVRRLATRLLPTGMPRRMDVELVTTEPNYDELQRLHASTCGDQRATYRVAWSAEWMKWRFAEASGRAYSWIQARRAGQLVAAVAWGSRSTSDAVLSALIGEDAAALRGCVATAVGAARRAGYTRMVTVNSDTAIHPVLRATGFFRRNQVPFIVRSMTDRTWRADMHDMRAWKLQPADLDTF